ncbi:hypothetical protein DEB41_00855 [Vibrio anguillarum]|uniref:Uncharacterized protein n=6 Tax=Vibrio anguillarum TaxID=55601 RepID=A0A1Y0NRV0_VIBAN|nr:hypothetical protein [Vibrio anguillarum]EHK2924895.1 hypothetical protein [Vibrio parahaemolyticus]AEH31777.1 hypothetical protein VAA_00875 [Vibrio anguillarum 775]AGU56461.1 hypothetical protein N175_00950 [Vibrio anguillarum M3]ARV25553.1 hypothetical protein A6A12_2790 [Vibrio anguillarum]ASF90570.1 hypothetical protein CEA93_00170 [Vibrio anguillarum]
MKVLEKNQTKVLETEKLLREIITSPAEFKDDEELLKALKSQSDIAKYQDQNRTIEPCSLNTLKSNAESLLERGFVSLDELRINAKLAIEAARLEEKASKGNKTTVVGLQHKVAELESELDAAQRSNFLLTVMVSELRSRLKQLANHEGTVEERQELYRTYNKKVEAELNYTLNGEV